MHMMMKVNIPVEAGKRCDPQWQPGDNDQRILAELKPTAAYFAEEHGERTGYIFLTWPTPHTCRGLRAVVPRLPCACDRASGDEPA